MSTTGVYHLVELQRPDDGWGELQALAARARTAAHSLSSEGTAVRFLRSIFVPESGCCFLLFQAESAEDAGLAAARADLAVRDIAAVETAAHPEDHQEERP
jgi:hypothetical protein